VQYCNSSNACLMFEDGRPGQRLARRPAGSAFKSRSAAILPTASVTRNMSRCCSWGSCLPVENTADVTVLQFAACCQCREGCCSIALHNLKHPGHRAQVSQLPQVQQLVQQLRNP
jgi:hypothetical protein